MCTRCPETRENRLRTGSAVAIPSCNLGMPQCSAERRKRLAQKGVAGKTTVAVNVTEGFAIALKQVRARRTTAGVAVRDYGAVVALGRETELPEEEIPAEGVLSPPGVKSETPVRGSGNRGRGFVTISAHFPDPVRRQLRMIAAMEDRTIQSLLGEALNDLFRKRGQLPIARE